MTSDWLRGLYAHMEWADATVWRTALGRPGPPDERLRALLLHVHIVQRAFLHVWTGRPIEPVFRTPESFATLQELQQWARPYYDEARQVIEGADEQRLAHPVVLPWSAQLATHLGRAPGVSTFGDTAFQVTSHSTYHRGQVNMRLRELGAEPPLVDYIAWVWFERPAPDWNV